MTEFRAQEAAPGAFAVFRVIPGVPTSTLAGQLPRRERWVLLLLDGRRTVSDLARLTQRSELDVASTLVKFLQRDYIEPINIDQLSTTRNEQYSFQYPLSNTF